jgi:hypothetical protein
METGACVVWPTDGLTRTFAQDASPADAARRARAGWRLSAAAGEYVTCHLALRTGAKLADLTVAPSALRARRSEIPERAIQVRWVGLVPVPEDAFSAEGAERPEYVPGWYPDPLLETPPWSGASPPRSAAVHFTLHVPPQTPAGVYRGAVAVRRGTRLLARVPLRVEVWPFALPARPTFHVTNWFQLDCLTKWHRCAPWSERHWRLLELYGREMADHRQDTIATPTLFGNFHNFDQMTLVAAARERDGRYTFDFRLLERWVKLFDRLGFAFFEMWHLASQHGGATAPRIDIFDRAQGRVVRYEALATTGAAYRRLVADFLQALSAWLDRRGLTDRFLLHVFDEPSRDRWAHYAALSAFYRRHAPRLKHIDAISTSELLTDFGGQVDIPVPLTTHLGDDRYYQERAQAGREPVWWYTCCGPAGRYANRFVAQPLITTRILHWQAFVHRIAGYLHWGYNFWHRTGQNASGWPGVNRYADQVLLNPYREHPPQWAVGDACIVYPHPRWWEDRGPVSSLRYEAMREGLQDYELLRMVDQRVADGALSAPARRAAHALLRRVRGPLAGSLTDFSRDAQVLLAARAAIGRALAT